MPKRVLVSVTNDIVTDQRVLKVSDYLIASGAEVSIIGRKMPWSLDIDSSGFKVLRYKMLFKRGFLFYKFFNIRLLFTLLNRKADLLVSNDLDTLLPNYLVSKIKNIPLVYDAHEYFTGVPELKNRPIVRMIWKTIERLTLPGVKHMMTVNDSIASLYSKEYGLTPVVIKNYSREWNGEVIERSEFGIDSEDLICIIQGTGINTGRGGIELIDAISDLRGVHLIVLGRGDQINHIKDRVLELGLINTVTFLPVMKWEDMMSYTAMADVGLSLDGGESLNYRYSLPNKIFDYMNAGLALIATNLFEVSSVIKNSGCGLIIESSGPGEIKNALETLRDNKELLMRYKQSSGEAAKKFRWENEKVKLGSLYKEAGLI